MFELHELDTNTMQQLESDIPEKYISDIGWADDLAADDLEQLCNLDTEKLQVVMDTLRVDPDQVPFDGDKRCDNPGCDRSSAMTSFILLGNTVMEVCLFCQGLTETVTDGSARMPKDSSFWDKRFLGA